MPNVDALDQLLDSWLLATHSLAEERAVWALKMKCKQILQRAVHPDALAARMVKILRSERRLAA